MILFLEPISKNMSMYVPAYPLPLMEIASFVKDRLPDVEMGIISIPVDYGLPLTPEGKENVDKAFLKDLSEIRPKGVGISCTAIVQAEEAIRLAESIKGYDPDIFVFMGGYFPTIYYEEIFFRTSAVDLIVVGEGEWPTLKIIECLEKGKNPTDENIPNIAWKRDGKICTKKMGARFDLTKKAPLNLELLRYPKAFDVLPYSFSRGCPYRCNFCMEEFVRPTRKAIPSEIVQRDLINLSQQTNSRTLLVSDALFKSFDLFPFLRSLGMKVTFETRGDILDPSLIRDYANVFGMMALGFESASYSTLRRMNKVRDKDHYEKYLSNSRKIFEEAVKNEIPIMVFLIAGYPGDTEKDLEESLHFVRELSKNKGPGGYIFNIGECRVYLKARIYDLAVSLPDVVFDNDGVFGENIVRRPSKDVDFEMVLAYIREIFNLSDMTSKLNHTIWHMMPFNRLPPHALRDEMIPDRCFGGKDRDIFNTKRENLIMFRELVPGLHKKYEEWVSGQRSKRNLPF